ncbi:MAG: hypothetical protein IKP95_09400 [Ruminococcus sp.]|nr:hypothetical protein [Ruminococcus sp.]
MKYPVYEKKWVRCPYCGAKVCIYDNNAECKGVYLKCTRGCRREFELKISKGEQEPRLIIKENK